MVVCPSRKLNTLFACGDAALARVTDGPNTPSGHDAPWRALQNSWSGLPTVPNIVTCQALKRMTRPGCSGCQEHKNLKCQCVAYVHPVHPCTVTSSCYLPPGAGTPRRELPFPNPQPVSPETSYYSSPRPPWWVWRPWVGAVAIIMSNQCAPCAAPHPSNASYITHMLRR